MAYFKYTVANKEGKRLSGSVEAPNETIARKELNNLGFSILSIKKTEKKVKIANDKLIFLFEAIDKNGKEINGTIPATTERSALTKLKEQYELRVTALWEEHATKEEIKEAKKRRTKELEKEIMEEEIAKEKEQRLKDATREKRKQFIKTKIEAILSQTDTLLKKFDKEIDADQKAIIKKQIDKILRIKQSENLEYILATAEDLLKLIKDQEKNIKAKGHQEQRYQFKEETKKLLTELKKDQKANSLSEDIVNKIELIEKKVGKSKKSKVKSFLNKIKTKFTKPAEVLTLEASIRHKNKEIIRLIKIWFQEPTKKYKLQAKKDIIKIWKSRKKTKHILSQVKKLLRQRGLKIEEKVETNKPTANTIINELNTITGCILFIYLIFYIIALYITTKNFGLSHIPKPFYIYKSKIFKYLIAIFFLLHSTTAIKINFFPKNKYIILLLFPLFIIGSTLILLNF